MRLMTDVFSSPANTHIAKMLQVSEGTIRRKKEDEKEEYNSYVRKFRLEKAPFILINDYNMVLVYPVLIVTNKAAKDYDESIEKFIRHINTKYLKREISISVKYRVFFVFLPIDNVEKVKRGVLKCIENNQKLLD